MDSPTFGGAPSPAGRGPGSGQESNQESPSEGLNHHGLGADRGEPVTLCLLRAARSAHTLTGKLTAAPVTAAVGANSDAASPAFALMMRPTTPPRKPKAQHTSVTRQVADHQIRNTKRSGGAGR